MHILSGHVGRNGKNVIFFSSCVQILVFWNETFKKIKRIFSPQQKNLHFLSGEGV